MSGSLALDIGIVVIGRNEGQRLVDCLASLPKGVPVVYVDSGSTDDSVTHAKKAGAVVHSLDMSRPFSAARARNAGFEELDRRVAVTAVQFLDGDTVLQAGWLEAATAYLKTHTDVVAVAGRRREKFPEASWYNALCDIEWNTPIGEARAVGGDALYRADAFRVAGGFNPIVIAGEEPELCLRLRRSGGYIMRLDHDMTAHDAAIHSFGAWWKRAGRSGYAFALGALMHGRSEERYRVRETLRAIIWGGLLPFLALITLVTGPRWVPLIILGVYAVKWVRLGLRHKGKVPQPWRYAGFLMLTNIAEVRGIVQCGVETLTGKRKIMEYK